MKEEIEKQVRPRYQSHIHEIDYRAARWQIDHCGKHEDCHIRSVEGAVPRLISDVLYIEGMMKVNAEHETRLKAESEKVQSLEDSLRQAQRRNKVMYILHVVLACAILVYMLLSFLLS